MTGLQDHQRAFIDLALSQGVLRFGEFTLKSGRTSPYFFNAGLFNTGSRLAGLGRHYAATIAGAGLPSNGGAQVMTRGTPATLAVMTLIWAEASSGYLPPGT